MKKWIWLSSIGLIVLLGLTINILLNALKPLHSAEAKAEEIALAETNIEQVTDFTLYNGTNSYYIVKGTNQSGEKLIAWIPEEEKERKIIVRNEEDGISKEAAIDKLYQSKEPDEVVSVKLGMENQIPLWEIYYRSNDKLINYYYIDFKTGEWLKDIQNL
ncbi:peptidase M4 [Robertmurraya siralis]|uniref:Peptidase M4 n=1 Tax=Robertmurraya siralis TaxID=77777 RepID=A0A919WFD1_9BACI|nr:DUF5590 domain-containing protein [Robertmurraya siralis]PAE22258.1 peptidase [Bacillus sp. 7504-2]GIN60773.1 peptidase M4 [Robertmurraya siralis]